MSVGKGKAQDICHSLEAPQIDIEEVKDAAQGKKHGWVS